MLTCVAPLSLQGVIKPGLDHLCDAYRSKAAQLGRDLLGLRERGGSVTEALRERTEENRALEAMVRVGQLSAQVTLFCMRWDLRCVTNWQGGYVWCVWCVCCAPPTHTPPP